MIVYNSNGEKVTLDDEPISSGGEGAVYKIKSPSSYKDIYCVKVYYEKKRTEDRFRKIDFMAKNPPQTITRNGCKIGWPVDVIFLNKKDFAGFMMPLAFPDSKKLTVLTGLTLSKRLDSSWQKFDRKSGRTALVARMKLMNNISIPIFLLHQTGMYVLQDFKPDNVLVTHNGLVTLCDMDSIQIVNNRQLLYPGTAVTLDYAPPERIHLNVVQSLGTYVDISWDNFVIAVVYYQLLFGIHPYTVTPKKLKDGECNELSVNIEQNLFPFGSHAKELAVIPAPHNNFKVIPSEMQSFFIRAFSDEVTARPRVEEWGKLIHKLVVEAGKMSPPPPSTPGSGGSYTPPPFPPPSPTGDGQTFPPVGEPKKKSGCLRVFGIGALIFSAVYFLWMFIWYVL